LRVLIPVPGEVDETAFKHTRVAWLAYLEEIRIQALVIVFRCQPTSLNLNGALRYKVRSDQTRMTLISMRRDPTTDDKDPALHDGKVNLDRWLLQCQQRTRELENCIFLWNAGISVIYE
jgi:hypothetical protein